MTEIWTSYHKHTFIYIYIYTSKSHKENMSPHKMNKQSKTILYHQRENTKSMLPIHKWCNSKIKLKLVIYQISAISTPLQSHGYTDNTLQSLILCQINIEMFLRHVDQVSVTMCLGYGVSSIRQTITWNNADRVSIDLFHNNFSPSG